MTSNRKSRSSEFGASTRRTGARIAKLDNFNHLKDEQSAELRDNEHFIQINYQDILDGIVVPLLHSTSLSSRSIGTRLKSMMKKGIYKPMI